MSELTHLERAAMQKLLDGEDEVFSILRGQLETIAVIEREMTGVGFYTTFSLPDGTRRVAGNPTFKFGDVVAEVPGLSWGAGFLLYVQDGAVHMLEGYTYDEPWPQQISVFELMYATGDRRDAAKLPQVLGGRGSSSTR